MPKKPEAASSNSVPINAELSFEAALGEVEQCVRQLESGELPLAEALAAFKRSSALLKHAQEKLDGAQAEIKILEDGVLRPFLDDDDDEATDPLDPERDGA